MTRLLRALTFLLAAARKGLAPARAVDTVGQRIVFKLPGFLLTERRVAGFNRSQHILRAIAARRGAHGGQQQPHQAVGQQRLLDGDIRRDIILPQHRVQHGGIGRHIAAQDGDIAIGHATPRTGHDFLRDIMRLRIRRCRLKERDMLRDLLIRRGRGAQQACFQSADILRRIHRLAIQPQPFAAQPSLAQARAQTLRAVAHRRKAVAVRRVLPIHHQIYPRRAAAGRDGAKQPGKIIGNHIKAIDQDIGVLHQLGLRHRVDRGSKHVLAIHKLISQDIRIPTVDARQIAHLFSVGALRQGIGVCLQLIRRDLRTLHIGNPLAALRDKAAARHRARIVFQILFAGQQRAGQGNVLAVAVHAHAVAAADQKEPLHKARKGKNLDVKKARQR